MRPPRSFVLVATPRLFCSLYIPPLVWSLYPQCFGWYTPTVMVATVYTPAVLIAIPPSFSWSLYPHWLGRYAPLFRSLYPIVLAATAPLYWSLHLHLFWSIFPHHSGRYVPLVQAATYAPIVLAVIYSYCFGRNTSTCLVATPPFVWSLRPFVWSLS